MAEFQGRTIDLSKGWQGAAICRAVSTRVRCFATREEARDDVAAAARVSVAGMSAAADCGGSGAYLAMFSGTNYTGSELDLYDTSGGWANLSAYGFDNAMQSWANGKTCDALVADGTGGTGSRLTLTAKGKSANAGSWNSRASSANVPF